MTHPVDQALYEAAEALYRGMVARHRAILADVIRERIHQETKFGDQSGNSLDRWYVILGEEFGAVGNAILEWPNNPEAPGYPNLVKTAFAHLRDELIQVAAVAVAIVERIDKSMEANDA